MDGELVTLDAELMMYAFDVAYQRHTVRPSRPTPNSDRSLLHIDQVGAIAEVAACLFYGEDPYHWVRTYAERPGISADLEHAGYRVSVKGTDRWDEHLFLRARGDDTHNDIHLLVSVDMATANCGMRGWITKQELLRYPVEAFRAHTPTAGPPTAKGWRYVPTSELRPCRKAAPPTGATEGEARWTPA
jgi:hypothetical protein